MAKATRSDNARRLGAGSVQTVRVLSSRASEAVGRPGFRRWLPGVKQGKIAVRRLMRNDPAVGITQPGAEKIVSMAVHEDIVGDQAVNKLGVERTTPSYSGQKAVRAAPASKPVKR